jgi:hypothetical protein
VNGRGHGEAGLEMTLKNVTVFVTIVAAGALLSLFGWSGIFAAPSKANTETQNIPRIWFAPLDPIVRPRFGVGGASDFMELFTKGSGWDAAASSVRVFKLYPQFLSRASDADLAAVIKGLKERHIALALEFGLLHSSRACGNGIEGYNGPGALRAAKRILKLGGILAFVAADEPLFFGNYFNGNNACHTPLKSLAVDAAATARSFRSVFPNIRFVDIEPIMGFKSADWTILITRWLKAFSQAYGENFAAFHMDIDWAIDWQPRAITLTKLLRAAKITVGVIYNGNPKDASDQAWLDNALKHSKAYESLTGGSPNDAVFQSWVPHPSHVLPEKSRGSFTNIIVDYARSHHLLRGD